MKMKFTTQDVIDMGAELYDNKGFTREQIRIWLHALIESNLTDCNFEKTYDLIVG